MINNQCRIGKNTKAARRIAGMLMSGVLAGTMAAGGAGAVTAAAAGWSENADYIFEYLTQELGYTEAAACGIMANIRCESTFNPHAWNAGGGSYGLCQWTGGRYGRLRSWCRSNGFDYTTIDGQLAYLEYELENFYPGVESHLRSVENTSDGAYDAGQYYCYHFEAPASRGSVSVYRGGLASGTFWDSYRPAEWYQVDGVWHYILRDGSYQTEWLTIEDDTFYFDGEGNRISGWRTIDGDRYFFDEDGAMVKGWKKIDGRSFFFDSDGSLVTGVLHSGEDWYLLDEQGNIQASAAMEDFAPEWTAAAAERETALASAGSEAGLEQDTVSEDGQDKIGASLNSPFSGPASVSTDRLTETPASSGPALSLAEGPEQDTVSSVNMLREAAAAATAGSHADAETPAPADMEPERPGAEEEPAEALASNDAYGTYEEEEDYQASADAMQAAAMALAEGETAEETEETAAPIYIPDSATELAGPLPELSNETVAQDELPALSGRTDEDPAEEPDTESTSTEPTEDVADGSSATPAEEQEEERSISEYDRASYGIPGSGDSDESHEADTADEADEESSEVTAGSEEESDTADTEETADTEDTATSAAEESDEDREAEEADRAETETENEDSEEADKAETGMTSDVAEATADSEKEDTEDEAEDSASEEDTEAEKEDSESEEETDTEEEDTDSDSDVTSGEDSEDPDESDEKDQIPLGDVSDKENEEEQISFSEMETRRREDSEEETASGENGRIVISVDRKNIPELSHEDLEDAEELLEILRDEDLIKAVTGSGLDITPEVTAEVEQSEEDEQLYTITFRAEFDGTSTETTAVVRVSDK